MSERKSKQHRRHRVQRIMELFHFTQEDVRRKEKSDPTMKLLLAMSDRKFAVVISECAKTLAEQQRAALLRPEKVL